MPRICLPLLNARSLRLNFSLFVCVLGALLLPSQGHASCSTIGNVTTCTGTGFSFSSSLNTSVDSSITVSGISGTVTNISITLNNFDPASESSITSLAMALVSPGNVALDLISGVCGGNSTTFTLNDSGDTGTDQVNGMLPYLGSGATCASGGFSGTYYPSDWFPGQDVFNSPGPSTYLSGGNAGLGGSGTYNFSSAYGLPSSSNINGTWTLYAANQAAPADTGSLGSWSISFTTETATSTTTTLTPSPNGTTSLVYTSQDVHGDFTTPTSVTLTATVSPNPGGGTVTFYDSTGTNPGQGTVLASGIAVNGSGQAQTSVTFSTEGNRSISAVYSGDSSFATSTSTVANVLTTNHPYNPSGATFCNGPITINNNPSESSSGGASTPNPSLLALGTGFSQLSGTIESVTVSLNGVNLQTDTDLADLGFLLQAPGGETSGLGSSGNAFEFLSHAGNPYQSGSLTIADTGSAEIPYDTAPPCTTCLPTDNEVDLGSSNLDTFAAPAPSSFDTAAPTGSSTFATEFGGQGANNTWSLYVNDRLSLPTPLGTIGEWCLNFTMQTGANPTTTTVSGSPNPASITSGTTAAVTLTATVSSSGGTVNAGTVTFDDGSTELGTGTVTNGTATLGVSLSEGTHQIVAGYGGTNSGTVFGISSGKFDQRVDKATTVSGGGPYSYCNAGGIIAPGLGEDSGAAYPYPSNIFVTNLPGTVKATTISFNGFNTKDQGDLMSLLVGPSTNSNQWNNNLDFFSLTGSNVSSPSTINLTFADGGASLLSTNVESSGTYAPGSKDNLTFPQCGQNASDCGTENVGPPLGTSSTFTPTNKAATEGTSILGDATAAGVFGGTTASTYLGNGTWSLYLDDGGPLGGGEDTNLTQGWCVNFTENPVSATATAGHSGNGLGGDFVQGESGAQISVNVENLGVSGTSPAIGTAGDPSGTNPATVTDTLPAGLTFVSGSGTNWACGAAGQVVTCTNHLASVAVGSSYPALTINVNVASSAGSPLSNSVSVSGADISNTTSNTDSITVQPPPSLSVSVSHSGSFTQGQTGTWNVTVSDAAGDAPTAGTITVNDTLPTGYTLQGSNSAGTFTCGGVANVVTCTSVSGATIAAGSSDTIVLTVNVPANSPTSVSNSASAYGGGDPVHTSGSPATSNTDTVTVLQVPASISVTSGNGQSATVNGAFSNALVVTVFDANNVVITNPSASVTFTAPGSGASGIFSNSSNTIAASTNGSGQVSEVFTANTVAGAYFVSASVVGVAPATFSLANAAGSPANVLIVSGNGQTTFDTTPFSAPLVVGVEDTYGNPVSGATVTFTPPLTGPSVIFAGGLNTAITNSSGQATSAAMTANSQLGGPYNVSASAGTGSVNFQLTNTIGPMALVVVSGPSTAYVGIPIQLTVSAEDAGGNVETGVNDTLNFSSSDSAASLPPTTALTNGTGTFTVTLNTTGAQTITATDTSNSIAGTTGSITVSPVPILVVTSSTDDPASSGNCTQQSSSSSGSDASCSLRDALAQSANLGAADIFFDTTKFTPTTYAETNGTLVIPPNTSIFGLTSGTTVQGSSSGPVFSVANGVTASISHLTITGGSGPSGSGIANNGGTLTITNSTISNNSAATGGGIDSSGGALTITNSTISGNQATGGGGGGGIWAGGLAGTVSITNSTISGNTSSATGGGILIDSGSATLAYNTLNNNSANDGGGGLYNNSGTVLITNSTISGNSGGAGVGGGLVNTSGTLELTNTIVAGNTAAIDQDMNGAFSGNSSNNLIGDGTGVSGITNGSNGDQVGTSASPINAQLAPLGNNGGPTQTMLLLPGSPAICSGAPLSGTTTDQRGLPNVNTTYITGGTCVDVGSVQTNYSIGFTTQPSPISPATQIVAETPFQAAVTLSESGSPATSGVTIPLNLIGSGNLTGGSAATSSGVATYSGLMIDALGSSDKLQATLTLNGSLVLTATSSAFQVTGTPPFGALGKATDATNGSISIAQAHNLEVVGWAADLQDKAPVARVSVLIDGVAVGDATLNIPRPDVAKVIGSAYANSGWSFTYAATNIAVGNHMVTAMAYDSLGLSKQLNNFRWITVAVNPILGPPFGAIHAVDSSTNSTTVAQSDTLLVTGWAADAHDGAPVKRVAVLIDGNPVGNATLGLKRAGVVTARDDPAYLDSGWEFSYSAAGLSLGTHTVTAVAYDSLGQSAQIGSKTITVSLTQVWGPPFGSLDKAEDATTGSTSVSQSDNLLVSGWAGDAKDGAPVGGGVSILIDGVSAGNATLNFARPDVAKARGSAYLNSGWNFTEPGSGLGLGAHTVTAVITDSLGNTTKLQTLSFTVTN